MVFFRGKEVGGQKTVRESGEVTFKMILVFLKMGGGVPISILHLKGKGNKGTESTQQSLSLSKQTGPCWSLWNK